jgi:hypothetical protein
MLKIFSPNHPLLQEGERKRMETGGGLGDFTVLKGTVTAV